MPEAAANTNAVPSMLNRGDPVVSAQFIASPIGEPHSLQLTQAAFWFWRLPTLTLPNNALVNVGHPVLVGNLASASNSGVPQTRQS